MTPRLAAARLVHPDPPILAARIVPPASMFELPVAPHEHAQGFASWVVLLIVLAALLAGQRERFRGRDLVVALGVAAFAAPLIACRFEGGVAVASAWRWSSVLVLLGLSSLIWWRESLMRWVAGAESSTPQDVWPEDPGASKTPPRPPMLTAGLVRSMTGTLLALSFLPLVVMALYVGSVALTDRPVPPGLQTLWGWSGFLFVILAGASLAVRLAPMWTHPEDAADGAHGPTSLVLLVLGALPLLAVTVYGVGTSLIGNAVVGPEPTSLFARIGNGGSYVPPIVLLAIALIGYAVRERSEGFALAGGLFLNLAATIAFMLAAVGGGRPFDLVLATQLAQLNAIVSSLYALAWMGAIATWRRRQGIAPVGPTGDLLAAATILGVALNLVVWVSAALGVFLEPVPLPAPSPWLTAVGGPLGWAALAVALAAVVLRARQAGRSITPGWRVLAVVAGALFVALNLAVTDTGNWTTYHGLLAGQALVALQIALAAWQRHGRRLGAVPEATLRGRDPRDASDARSRGAPGPARSGR